MKLEEVVREIENKPKEKSKVKGVKCFKRGTVPL